MTRRKDRVLNARIPAELDRELREQARRLDMPVSQLVRDVLSRTVDLLGNLTGNVETLVAGLAEDVDGLRRAGEPAADDDGDALDDIIGWQPVEAHRATTCALDGVTIERGERAWLGVQTDGSTGPLIADATMERLREPPPQTWSEMKLHRAVTCAHTGETIEPGDTAWYQPGTTPMTIICDTARRALRGAASAASRTKDATSTDDDGAEA